MQHDVRLRAAARAIFNVCGRSDDHAAVSFEEAERWRTVRYHQAVDAALQARAEFNAPVRVQLKLIG